MQLVDAASITRFFTLCLVGVTLTFSPAQLGATRDKESKLDPQLRNLARLNGGYSPVIIRATDKESLKAIKRLIRESGGSPRRSLSGIMSEVAIVPNVALPALAASAYVETIALDRVVVGAMERTGITIGAASVRTQLGFDGEGVGVAIVDSGITSWHDDLADTSGTQRVDRFVDFVNGAQSPYDDYGHGTHVAGIIAGNGADSKGARTGIAPRARLVVLKALDAAGRGRISDVIAAIEYAVAERDALNIRVLNLSLASGVYQSVTTDPLALATERAVNAGIVVVAAGGNNGVSPAGRTRYGGITSPGNAPWVLTVGGFSHMGTNKREDDTIAVFSSRGPAAVDHGAKPDVAAPAVGIESLAAPDSALYRAWTQFLLPGIVKTTSLPYLSLSGTSMAAPVVAGTVTLMLQANPALTPNQVKAILQYTARFDPDYDYLTQGAGFVNAKGAVELARHLVNPATIAYPDSSGWSRRIIWGNYSVKNGRITSDANAWSLGVAWGAAATPTGQIVEWGYACSTQSCDSPSGQWSLADAKPRNVVWGTVCGGDDCEMTWSLSAISGASDSDTVVWGTSDDGETVVWGTLEDAETVVWGTVDDGETVVWGTSCGVASCLPTIWRP
jgi:serine protease AprX